jgi:hypothetical protein
MTKDIIVPTRIYWVGQFKVKSGMDTVAREWWREKGKPDILAEACTKSLRAYAVQFALGGKYTVEIWQELENFAVLDTIEKDVQDNLEFYLQHMEHLQEAESFIEWGPARLLREWLKPSNEPDNKYIDIGHGPYWVGQFKIKSGMDFKAIEWWREKGEPDILNEACTKSLKTYAVQFALGGDYTVEIWQELENYSVLDQVELDIQKRPEFYANHTKHLSEAHAIIEWGPARLMKEWLP